MEIEPNKISNFVAAALQQARNAKEEAQEEQDNIFDIGKKQTDTYHWSLPNRGEEPVPLDEPDGCSPKCSFPGIEDESPKNSGSGLEDHGFEDEYQNRIEEGENYYLNKYHLPSASGIEDHLKHSLGPEDIY